ncbi:hypothetical protein VP01_4150g1, partial [Puccinia sorghi]
GARPGPSHGSRPSPPAVTAPGPDPISPPNTKTPLFPLSAKTPLRGLLTTLAAIHRSGQDDAETRAAKLCHRRQMEGGFISLGLAPPPASRQASAPAPPPPSPTAAPSPTRVPPTPPRAPNPPQAPPPLPPTAPSPIHVPSPTPPPLPPSTPPLPIETPSIQVFPHHIPSPRSVLSVRATPNPPLTVKILLKLQGFLQSCKLLFSNDPTVFSDDCKKVLYAASYLGSRASQWPLIFPHYFRQLHPILLSYSSEEQEHTGYYPTVIHSDCGTKSINNYLLEFCNKNCIRTRYSDAYTPQQNGLAERFNRNIIESTRAILKNSNLSLNYWNDVIKASTLTLNQIPAHKSKKSPFELFRNHSLPLNYFKPIGLKVSYLYLPENSNSKLAQIGCLGTIVGYNEELTSHRVATKTGKTTGLKRILRLSNLNFKKISVELVVKEETVKSTVRHLLVPQARTLRDRTSRIKPIKYSYLTAASTQLGENSPSDLMLVSSLGNKLLISILTQ